MTLARRVPAIGIVVALGPLAVAAMLLVCVCLAVVFRRLARALPSRGHRRAVEIGGIGAMVYAFLVVTPMHDLMVTIALLFGLAALLAAVHATYLERRWPLVLVGGGCIGLLLLAATMYYGQVLHGLLPVAQKVALLACIGWVLRADHALHGRPLTPGAA